MSEPMPGSAHDLALFEPSEADAHNAALRAEKERYEAMGKDAQRTYRNNLSIERGIHPTTGRTLLRAMPEDERIVRSLAGVPLDATCADCRFCESISYHSRSFVKCKAVVLTHGPGSDTRKKWPACTKFQARGQR